MFFKPNLLLTQNKDRAVMEFRCFSSLGNQAFLSSKFQSLEGLVLNLRPLAMIFKKHFMGVLSKSIIASFCAQS